MSSTILYTRTVSDGGKVTYREHSGATIPATHDLKASKFDTAECITWAVSLAMMQLMILRKQLPEHARNARKIKTIEDAIYDLAKGHGAPIDDELVDLIVGTWNTTMQRVQEGLTP